MYGHACIWSFEGLLMHLISSAIHLLWYWQEENILPYDSKEIYDTTAFLLTFWSADNLFETFFYANKHNSPCPIVVVAIQLLGPPFQKYMNVRQTSFYQGSSSNKLYYAMSPKSLRPIISTS